MVTFRVNKATKQIEMNFHLRNRKPVDITKGLGKEFKSKWAEAVENGSKLVWHPVLGENVRKILKGIETEKQLEPIKIESYINEESHLFKPFLKSLLEFNIMFEKSCIEKKSSPLDHKFFVSPEKVLDAIDFSRSDKQYLFDLYQTAKYKSGFRSFVVRSIGQTFSKNDADVYDFLDHEWCHEIGIHNKTTLAYAIENAMRSMDAAKKEEDKQPTGDDLETLNRME
jgi:hypothetical protein